MADGTLNIHMKEAKLDLNTLLLYKIYKLLARTYPIETDEDFFRTKSVTIAAGKTVNTDWFVPKDSVWYLQEFSWNYESDSEYRIYVDDGALTVDKMDFSIQPIVLNPPRRCHAKIRISIKNNSTTAKTYNLYIKGWRRYK